MIWVVIILIGIIVAGVLAYITREPGAFFIYALIAILLTALLSAMNFDGCFIDKERCVADREQRRIDAIAREKDCRTPKLVSKAGDAELYSVMPGGCGDERPVYFSKSGTRTSHEECWYSGKVRHCKEVYDEVTTTP